MTDDSYHTDHTHVSRSMLWTFRRSRQEYYRRYVLDDAPREKPGRAMELGTVVHAMALEPLKCGDVFVISPYSDFRTKEAREWKEQQNGKIVLKRDEHDQCTEMAISLKEKFRHLLDAPGAVETAIQWVDKETGLSCKCKPDKLVNVDGQNWVLDIKTAADATPEAFRSSAEKYGYWLQGAHYGAGAEQHLGLSTRFGFLVVQNTWPYHAAAYELDEESSDVADEKRAGLLRELADCRRFSIWRDDWDRKTNQISIREWAW